MDRQCLVSGARLCDCQRLQEGRDCGSRWYLKANNESSDSDGDIMLGSTSRNSQSNKTILFSVSVGHRGKWLLWFLAEEDWSIINHQWHCILTFCLHFFKLSWGCTLYLLLNVCERLSAWVSWVPVCIFCSMCARDCLHEYLVHQYFLWLFVFFLLFLFVFINLLKSPCVLSPVGGWSTL